MSKTFYLAVGEQNHSSIVIMATTDQSSGNGSQSQVRIKLNTRHAGLSLPEDLRTILVDTSKML